MLKKPEIESKMPTKYIGLSPENIDFESDFEKLSDQEKLELVYYIERNSIKRAGRLGFLVGIGVSLTIAFLLAPNL